MKNTNKTFSFRFIIFSFKTIVLFSSKIGTLRFQIGLYIQAVMHPPFFTKSTYAYQQPDPIYVIELANINAIAWAVSKAIKLQIYRKLRDEQTISEP